MCSSYSDVGKHIRGYLRECRFNDRTFHKTLPRSNALVSWIKVSFYETGFIDRVFPENGSLSYHALYSWIDRVFIKRV